MFTTSYDFLLHNLTIIKSPYVFLVLIKHTLIEDRKKLITLIKKYFNSKLLKILLRSYALL